MTFSNVRAGPAVTLRDVARVAGVHPATVSRALNEETRALVNEATARRVLKAAEKLGYQPNPIARGLKTNRSFTIGVLIPDLTNPLFPPILRGIGPPRPPASRRSARRWHRARAREPAPAGASRELRDRGRHPGHAARGGAPAVARAHADRPPRRSARLLHRAGPSRELLGDHARGGFRSRPRPPAGGRGVPRAGGRAALRPAA